MMKTLALISFAALAGATSAAQAANCPRGQIYRVSKHVCVDRNDAAKLGIVNGAARDVEKAAPAPDAAPDADVAPAPAPAVRASPARAGKIAHPKRPAPETPVAPDASAPGLAAPELATHGPAAQIPPAGAPVKAEAPQPAAAQNPFGVLDPNNVPTMARNR
jgi:hypothetical protein